MKLHVLIFVCIMSLPGFAQSEVEGSILQLSGKVFQWEVTGQMDSVAAILDSRFVVAGSDGSIRSKEQYLQRLTAGNFVHNSIEVEESHATVAENTAIVSGKGSFIITSSGNKSTLHLSYLEVFSRKDDQSPWKLLAIKANAVSNQVER